MNNLPTKLENKETSYGQKQNAAFEFVVRRGCPSYVHLQKR